VHRPTSEISTNLAGKKNNPARSNSAKMMLHDPEIQKYLRENRANLGLPIERERGSFGVVFVAVYFVR